MNKADLRVRYLHMRRSIPDATHQQWSHQLCTKFFDTTDFSKVRILHTYLPLQQKHEPDTRLIVDRIRLEFPHIRISLPRVNQQTQELEHVFYERGDQLKINGWNIPEPESGELTVVETIDMVIVPLLIFDLDGNRVGYGKGFYDKFLAQCKKSCVRVGLSYFEPVDKIEDVNEFDQPLSFALTPSNTFSF